MSTLSLRYGRPRRASWRNLSTAHLALPFYPFMFVAPNGKVFCAGPSQATRYLDVTGTGAWSLVGNSNYGTRNWGSSVMYDDGKVLIMGGSPCGRLYREHCTTPNGNRRDHRPKQFESRLELHWIDGDGRTQTSHRDLACGRQSSGEWWNQRNEDPNTQPSNPAYACEMWDPATGTWTTMASLTTIRGYHSVALLLPDGRVLSAGAYLGRTFSRNIFASLSVQRLASHYHVGTHEHCIWSVVFRRHTQRHKHFKGDIDRAFLRDTRL